MNRYLATSLAAALLSTAACHKKDEPAPAAAGSAPGSAVASGSAAPATPAAPAKPVAPPDAPAAAVVPDGKAPALRARELLEKQVAALASGKNDELLAMFAPGAIALVPEARTVEPALDLVGKLGKPAAVKIGKVTAGDTAGAIWIEADLALGDRTVRLVELLDGPGGWKIAVASFGVVHKGKPGAAPGPVPAPTDAGPIAALLGAPMKLAAALFDPDPPANPDADQPPDVFVVGPEKDERGSGLVDAKLLAYKLAKQGLVLDPGVHEVHTAAWGYAIGNLSKPTPMTGLAIAVPGAAGAWSVVATAYNAL